MFVLLSNELQVDLNVALSLQISNHQIEKRINDDALVLFGMTS